LKKGVCSISVSSSICWSNVSAENLLALGKRRAVSAWSSAVLLERDERAIDEVDHAGLARPRRLVRGNDLRGHGLDFDSLLGREEGELEPVGLGSLEHVLLGGEDRRIVGQHPGTAQARGRLREERATRLAFAAHGDLPRCRNGSLVLQRAGSRCQGRTVSRGARPAPAPHVCAA
jgi:hypothetical protein